MPSMTTVTCHNKSCKKEFQARTTDVKRGWGKFCSKSCKAIEQENRTGQYKDYLYNKSKPKKKIYYTNDIDDMFDRKIYEMDHPIDILPKEDWDFDGPFDC